MPTDLKNRITISPSQCGGRPCVRGMRIKVSDVLELLGSGMSYQDVLSEHPDLELDDIKACLQYAAQQIAHPVMKVA